MKEASLEDLCQQILTITVWYTSQETHVYTCGSLDAVTRNGSSEIYVLSKWAQCLTSHAHRFSGHTLSSWVQCSPRSWQTSCEHTCIASHLRHPHCRARPGALPREPRSAKPSSGHRRLQRKTNFRHGTIYLEKICLRNLGTPEDEESAWYEVWHMQYSFKIPIRVLDGLKQGDLRTEKWKCNSNVCTVNHQIPVSVRRLPVLLSEVPVSDSLTTLVSLTSTRGRAYILYF